MTASRVLVAVPDLDAAIEHYRGLDWRIDRISPADDPIEVDMSRGDGLLRLRRDAQAAGWRGHVHPDPRSSDLPTVTENDDTVIVPELVDELSISLRSEATGFGAGRAGMGYRDLIPGRLGGRFIASHIRIDEAGPVPDYAHYHHIRFQMIFCRSGWVRVVYEDQGEPFVLESGDCVLQPPGIRHRVLESSAGLEVVEIGCPAEHDTFADHDIALPTGRFAPDRDFGGQRFVRHVASDAQWEPWNSTAVPCRDLGIGTATAGLAGARVARTDRPETVDLRHDGEFRFLFVLEGGISLRVAGEDACDLGRDDSVAVPARTDATAELRAGTEVLEVTLPG
ncbi:MAG: cupin [Actinomycetota bacterium]